ncbi:hypothetical protein FZC79_18390 [Rossellomorea vietnamensis]|uniref:GAF domain-containing protein n=1 Tax=Rossellomorea vietnamensis TaxID=218284 RepID=A0A5D4KBC3_9BACI|nr:hypothetical protein [Rossellomorea vietnamensis]TYR73413.1 hypothetical protein FZC79_18390 [Rossellomorea vietnamensis]
MRNNVVKCLELLGSFMVLFSIELLADIDFSFWKSAFILLVVLLFSLRYGWRLGAAALGTGILYLVGSEWVNGSDILLLFFDIEQAKWLMLFLSVYAVSAVIGTRQKERYNDLQDEFLEVKEELGEHQKTVELLEGSRQDLLRKIYEFEQTPETLLSLLKYIHSSTSDTTAKKLMAVIRKQFKAEDVRFYVLDERSNSMKLKYFLGDADESMEKYILIKNSLFFQTLLSKRKVLTRRLEDEGNVPLIAGAVTCDGQVSGVLTIGRVAFERLNPYDLELLQTLLDWTSYCQDHRPVTKESKEQQVV